MNVRRKKGSLNTEHSLPVVKGQGIAKDILEKGAMDVAQEIRDPGLRGRIVLEIKGDSMEKLIMDGTKVVVDTRDRTITSGAIYALDIPWEGSIIRECYSEPEGLLLRPHNRNYPEALLGWEEFDPEIVLGKVYCSILNVFR